jgi:hypothetical protein
LAGREQGISGARAGWLVWFISAHLSRPVRSAHGRSSIASPFPYLLVFFPLPSSLFPLLVPPPRLHSLSLSLSPLPSLLSSTSSLLSSFGLDRKVSFVFFDGESSLTDLTRRDLHSTRRDLYSTDLYSTDLYSTDLSRRNCLDPDQYGARLDLLAYRRPCRRHRRDRDDKT